MDWNEAKENTVKMWRGIRDAVGKAEPLDLLVEINAITDLCEMARAEARGEWGRCRFCPAYQQFGGCQEVSARLSELVVDENWDELRRLTEQFIEQLKAVELPSEAQPKSVC